MCYHRFISLAGLILFFGLMPFLCQADDCTVPIGVKSISRGYDAPSEIVSQLVQRVESVVGQTNDVSLDSEPPFFVAVVVNDCTTNELAGPPRQTTVSLSAVLYLCDGASQRVIATCALDQLIGAGRNTHQATMQAIRAINLRNHNYAEFFNGISNCVVDYYNKYYPNLLKRVQTLAARQEYEEAMHWAFTIPECCQGYDMAVTLGLQVYQEWINNNGQKAYDMARAIWISQPDAHGARRALPVLLTIPVNSTAYSNVKTLIDEIYRVVKDDKQFVEREKYKDAVRRQEMKIEAAKEIGIAWGRGQQPTTTNLNWIK